MRLDYLFSYYINSVIVKNVNAALTVAVPDPPDVHLNLITVSVIGAIIVLIVGVLYCAAVLGEPLPEKFNGTNAAAVPSANVVLDELTMPISINGLELSVKACAENDAVINHADPAASVTLVPPVIDNPFDATTVSNVISVLPLTEACKVDFTALIYLGALRVTH
jgi:hypothetical protein